MEKDKVNIFSCNKAAYLMTNGVKPIGCGKQPDGLAYITFEASQEVQDILKWYYDPNQIISRFIRNYSDCRKIMRETVM